MRNDSAVFLLTNFDPLLSAFGKLLAISTSFTLGICSKKTFADCHGSDFRDGMLADLEEVMISANLLNSKANLINSAGQVIERFNISERSFLIDMGKYSKGVYLLQFNDGTFGKIIRK